MLAQGIEPGPLVEQGVLGQVHESPPRILDREVVEARSVRRNTYREVQGEPTLSDLRLTSYYPNGRTTPQVAHQPLGAGGRHIEVGGVDDLQWYYGHNSFLASTTQVASTLFRSRRSATSSDFSASTSVARRFPRPIS